jgi:hypoxanthine-DNA glycosylase
MNKDHEHGLPLLVGDDPAVLILGSFPSRKSLERKQYYANPQNQFWRIMAAFFCFENPGAIELNSEELKHHHRCLGCHCITKIPAGQWGSRYQGYQAE